MHRYLTSRIPAVFYIFLIMLIAADYAHSQSPTPTPCPKSAPGDSPVAIENKCNLGVTSWQINSYFEAALDHQIEGFADSRSVNKGETIKFFVNLTPERRHMVPAAPSTPPSAPYCPQPLPDKTPIPRTAFDIDIYRMGWYGGAGARLMHSAPNLTTAQLQPLATADLNTGLQENNWGPANGSYQWQVPANAVSGVYIAKLTTPDVYPPHLGQKISSYIIFVVRDDENPSKVFFKLADNTYQAYNHYPGRRDCLRVPWQSKPASYPGCGCSDETPISDPFRNGSQTFWGQDYSGKSLYAWPVSDGRGNPNRNGSERAVAVSFMRPY